MQINEPSVQERDLLQARSTAATSFMSKVYAKMSLALLITALTAWTTADSPQVIDFIFSSKYVFFALLGAEFLLVIAISGMIDRLSIVSATLLFTLYSVINGLTLSSIFLVFTSESIASTFVVSAATFGAMAIFGMTTKKDLSSWGKILMMALVGLIIASVVNMFFASSTLYWVTTYVGVFVFVGLTAYDTQKLKRIGADVQDNLSAERLSILGALTLYLDFINLFLYLLRIFGKRR